MITAIRKHSFSTGFAVLLLVMLALLSTGAELFHNHAPGDRELPNCPVPHIYQMFVGLALFILALLTGFQPSRSSIIPTPIFIPKDVIQVPTLRAPPAFLSD